MNENCNELDVGDYFENGLEVTIVQITEQVLTLMHEELHAQLYSQFV